MDDGSAALEIRAEGCGKQIMFYRARLLCEQRFRIFGKLTNEYAVDMLSRNLETRLNYIRANQKRLREEDAELMGEAFIPDSQNIYLPASFMGSRRWAQDQIVDSLTIAAHSGNPTFFITMTCNSDWPEIKEQLRPGQDFSDIPCDVIRVFKQKLSLLEQCLKTLFPNAGHLLYLIHSVEFQKRGLPHAHILCKFEHDCVHPIDIDCIISAEIPTNPADEELVWKLMLHRHPPPNKPHSRYCQRIQSDRRICRFGYPHALQAQTTVDSEGRVHYRRRKQGDEWVVPHCLPLLRKFQCHLNIEAANPSHLFQYLFKYIHKSASNLRLLLPGKF
jgi:Helitron helicase-like domain at N-terminus